LPFIQSSQHLIEGAAICTIRSSSICRKSVANAS
jgi:hypothetical protein